jgi:membrane-associated phospholipid phosphatase
MILILLLSVGIRLSPAYADEKAADEIRKLDLPNNSNSIYRLNYWTDTSIIASGFIITLVANANAYALITTQHCPCDPNGVNFLDHPDIYNDNHTLDIMANWTVAAAVIAPVIIDYLDVGLTKAFVEDMAVYTEVLSVNFGLNTIAKYSFQRPYPYMYRKTGTVAYDPSDYLSFYSGHTATTVSALTAASVALNLRHKKVLWPWVLTAVMGVSVGAELILSAEHFTSDVIVGAAMGLTIGTVIPGLHSRDPHWFDNFYVTTDQNIPEIAWKMDI